MTVGPALPGETCDEFVARILAAAPAPTSELMAFLRPLFPPEQIAQPPANLAVIVAAPDPTRPPLVWLSPKQAAARVGRHERTIRDALHEWVRTRGKSGLCGSQRAANCSWRIHVDDLDAWMRGEKQGRRRRSGT